MSSENEKVVELQDQQSQNMSSKSDASKGHESIEKFITQGNMAYAQKDYESAVEKYSQALMESEKIYGSDSLENRNILWLYGKSLFQVAVANSQVLGNAVDPDEGAEGEEDENKQPETIGSFSFTGQKMENRYHVPETSEQADTSARSQDRKEEGGSPEEQEQEQDEDDFSVAWEVLDLTRVMQTKAIEEHPESSDEKLRLADILDLLGELSLEIENFAQAAEDLESALHWKVQVYKEGNTLLSEAHYKLALALEFADPSDHSTKDRAREHVEMAAEILRGILEQRKSEEKDNKGKEREGVEQPMGSSINDLQEMLSELEQKADDLKHGAPSLEEAVATKMHESSLLSGNDGNLASAVADALKNANDLGGLVKRKRPKQESQAAQQEDKNKKPKTESE
ncbi:NASP family CENP-A chaperone [Schizosaccharomyces cryophilus OY26]|uniref:NASP family CENP-A chaperone n=1 Tax=Schizosaccharomyces cryophilus (strain OY26 / ATCC MYA-4695 / CBS 11777 / NBRC 106824 / NRRL Y48691) TaxID=653667 RepID=S9VTK9_SCHCR|nr:NASP family CENP-A chaperone [Schizosaccharomyces cryophilus OY26]EPY49484.1 NASP family CENP-A chaperone [Schizosaccharomyces cryophilus OY26]